MLERPTLIYKNTKPKKKKFKKNPISIVLDLRSWQKKSIDRRKDERITVYSMIIDTAPESCCDDWMKRVYSFYIQERGYESWTD